MEWSGFGNFGFFCKKEDIFEKLCQVFVKIVKICKISERDFSRRRSQWLKMSFFEVWKIVKNRGNNFAFLGPKNREKIEALNF